MPEKSTNSSKSTVVKTFIIICHWKSLQLYSTEYMSYDLGIFDDSVHGHNVACSVCLVPRSTAVSITMDFYVVTYISCQNQNLYFWSSHLFDKFEPNLRICSRFLSLSEQWSSLVRGFCKLINTQLHVHCKIYVLVSWGKCCSALMPDSFRSDLFRSF